MKLIRGVKRLINYLFNPDNNFYDRLFVLLTISSDVAIIIALICDMVIGDSIYEIVILAVTVILIPFITFVCLYKDRIKLAVRIIVLGLVFVILPSVFFFGGGITGGGVFWIVFAFLYIGLVLTGVWRAIMLALVIVMATICYFVEFFYPEYISKHTGTMAYMDSFVALMLVSIVCFVMVAFQNRMFRSENERAKKAAKEAEELNLAQNRFFSSMSHEIRTPINSILGLNELILREENISDEIVRDATGIQGSGKMLLSLINDILDFSKIEAGSMDIVPVEYDVGELMSEIVNMIWIKAQDKGLKLEVSVDPKVPLHLYGDEVRIKQILINLLNNAVKYTKEGTVGLHIESEDIGENSVMLRISVSDTGIGIKKDSIPYLFDAFKRVDEQKNRYIEGTGLGLSIVKQLVDLMDGSISVNTVYGEGSTFNVMIKQAVSDPTAIGELSIHNFGKVKKKAYESRFTAPEASVLIVDDNVMNLEVERKLLLGTKMRVDTAISGKEALKATLSNHYDVILMDHLMPEMDGIECLQEIRGQEGGLNQMTSVVVLTANAGSENKELYNHAGFDGYLVKPVSGENLEQLLINYIPQDKLNLRTDLNRMEGSTNATSGYNRKIPIVITTSSMCDLPDAIMNDPRLPIIPFTIQTENGIFKDRTQIGSDELVRYIKSGKKALSAPPEVADYTEFFASFLKTAHQIIYIAITSSMSDDYKRACEAAKAFDNVSVINSECLSSGTGILVLIACKLAQRDIPVEEVIAELEEVKKRLKCSFVVGNTEFMMRNGRISPSVHRFVEALSLRPCLRFKDDQSGLGGIFMGSRTHAFRRYIRMAFPVDQIPDSDVLFITYVDIDEDTLQWIKNEVSKYAFFEHIVFQQASAAISSNCGPGSFGLLYFLKSNKSYNISSLLMEQSVENVGDTETSVGNVTENAITSYDEEQQVTTDETEESDVPWYDSIEGIDGEIALKNSGSEEAFKTVLKIFYDSIDEKDRELEGFYRAQDWDNYTIKIHALKSSSKLIGAMDLSEKAQALENAGKEGNIDYIRDNFDSFMEEYRGYKNALAGLYETEESESDKPVADSFLMESVYEAVADAAENMECDAIDEALEELSEYAIPKEDEDKIKTIKDLAAKYDYDGISKLLS